MISERCNKKTPSKSAEALDFKSVINAQQQNADGNTHRGI